MAASDNENLIKESFRKFDTNNDGVISFGELKTVLNAVSAGQFDDAAVNALLVASDSNKDGLIQYDEFVRWVMADVNKRPESPTSPEFRPLDKRGSFKMDYRKLLPERFQVDVSERFDLDKKEVGAGGFGTVFIARDKEFEDRLVAVKKVQKPTGKDTCTNLEQEIKVMKDLDHPNICKLLATFDEGCSMYFVMELCEGGEVFDRIIDTGSISEKTTAIIIQQVVSALAHAHARGIAHRDIKPENVVFCSKDKQDLHVKLIDWGLAAAHSEEGNGMSEAVGSMTYAAPEVIMANTRKTYTEACDIWSVGVMTYVMLCGKPPFWGTREQHLRAARSERFPFSGEPWDKMNPPGRDFVKALIKAKPEKRLVTNEVVKHPWLQAATNQDLGQFDEGTSAAVLKNLSNFAAQSTFKRMCITAVARQLDHKHLKDIHQVFRNMDANGDGVLSLDEIQKGFKLLSGVENTQQVEDVFKQLDLDGSNTIDYTEFCAAGLDEKTSSQDDVIWAAFKTFDLNNSGYITTENLRTILDSGDIQNTWSEDVCREVGAEIVAKFDKDGDGKISFEDWRGIMQACWSKSNAPSAAAGGAKQEMGAYEILTMVSSLKLPSSE